MIYAHGLQRFWALKTPLGACAGTVLTFDVLNRYNTYSFGGAKASLHPALLSVPQTYNDDQVLLQCPRCHPASLPCGFQRLQHPNPTA